MLESGDPNPHWFSYPTLYIYTEAAVAWVASAFARSRGAQAGSPAMTYWIYLAARAMTAFLGTGAVLLAFLAARRLWGWAAGLGAGLVLALSFGHVQHSQFATTDVPSSFFVALCAWLAACAYCGDGNRWWVAAGAAAGLAAATKYNAGLCVALPLCLWAIGRVRPRDLLSPTPVLIAVAAALAFAIAVPWAVIDPASVVFGIQYDASRYQKGFRVAQGEHNWAFYLGYLWSEGLTPTLAMIVLAGWLLLLARWPVFTLGLSLFPLAYLWLIASVPARFTRNLMPVMPVLALCAGFAVREGWQRLCAPATARGLRLATGTLGLCIVALLGARIALYDRYLLEPDTRERVYTWTEANLPPGTSICVNNWFFLDRYRFDLSALFPPKRRSLLPLPCEYAVIFVYRAAMAYENPDLFPGQPEVYDRLFREGSMLAEFAYSSSPMIRRTFGDRLGVYAPVIQLYRVPEGMRGARAPRRARSRARPSTLPSLD